jgi:predicted RNA-binding protein with PUA-like domain
MEKQMKSGTYFLAKTDPETYSIDDLEREGQTIWDGVKNPQALRAIRAMKAGDKVFIYHSMGHAAVVGMAEVTGEGPMFRFTGRVEPPVTLREIKESEEFADWSLVKQSRLSTMEAPEKFVKWVRKLRPSASI